ncbi:uncharacterized protein EDB91DRAFT_1254994 [Suillus paluster]|uniref:uncharacterized protein n=1 Tax=Suillus paluster TaxID=48578 RepID=UPI001B879D48|nr:uncharacterized protein EDB91DRAFT_1254994 [Suillus paluster]KAG1724943.1 hypothetical protein EDB91DRAFT_1254994 [Suillus paluster]
MSTTSIDASKNLSQSSSPHRDELSKDRGALELGIESAWTCDETFVTGVKLSDSQRAEPPTSNQLSAKDAEGALGAPIETSTPLIFSNEGNGTKPPSDNTSRGSAPMSISPLLRSVAGQPSPILLDMAIKNDDSPNRSTIKMSEPQVNVSWADLPINDDKLGDLPEFPAQSPKSKASSLGSPPCIPAELKGKSVDTQEWKILPPKDWLDQWSDLNEGLVEALRPGSNDPDSSLRDIWDEDNKWLSIQLQNLYLRQYRNQVKEELVEQSIMTREEEAQKRIREAHQAPVISVQLPPPNPEGVMRNLSDEIWWR